MESTGLNVQLDALTDMWLFSHIHCHCITANNGKKIMGGRGGGRKLWYGSKNAKNDAPKTSR